MDWESLWSTPVGSDAVWKRRRSAASAWDRGGDDLSAAGGAYYGGSSGDRILDAIRNAAMSDALAGISSARSGAMTMSPNDPSLAASAGLRATLHGQGRAARAVTGLAGDYLRQKQMQAWQERMARLQAGNPMWGALGSLGGAALGAWL